MHPVRLQRRVPSSRFLEIARLSGYQLKFHKRHPDGSSKCNIVFSGDESDQVIGILYHILADEKHLLDEAEGVGKGYNITQLELTAERGSHIAFAYAADPLYIDDGLHPYPWYRALVVVGARTHGLPESYVRYLESHATIDDPDQERVDLHMAIVHSHTA